MKEVLKYLEEAEGIEVHRLKGEKDITAPYGIYRYAHPDAEIFKLIDSVAMFLGIETPSKEWSKNNIFEINVFLLEKKDEIKKLASKFYEEYLKPAHLELFPPLCRVAMFSMYVNSPKNAWKAVQQSLLDMEANGYYYRSTKLSVVDGKFGKKTKDGISKVNGAGKDFYLYFETLMLSNMKTLYMRMALSNPEKYLKYLKGWDNRMSKLARI